MSNAPAREQTYRRDPSTPERVEIPLTPSPWAAATQVGPMLKWVAMIVAFMVIATALEPYVRGDAKLLFPVGFMVAAAVFVANMYRRKPQPSLVLIERTLHRLDARGAIVETIADLRAELTTAVWSYSVKGTRYYGRALLLRFASGPLAVSLYPSAERVEGAPCGTPSWIIDPAHYARLIEAAR
jgi:hypothetical protein